MHRKQHIRAPSFQGCVLGWGPPTTVCGSESRGSLPRGTARRGPGEQSPGLGGGQEAGTELSRRLMGLESRGPHGL